MSTKDALLRLGSISLTILVAAGMVAALLMLGGCSEVDKTVTVAVVEKQEDLKAKPPIPAECRVKNRAAFPKIKKEGTKTPYANLEHAFVTARTRHERNAIAAGVCEQFVDQQIGEAKS